MKRENLDGRIEGQALAILRWRTGLIGCLLPLLVGATAYFGVAAVRPSLASELEHERRGWLIEATRDLTIGGVNIPLLCVALYVGWETLRFAWRWADGTAAIATPSHLVPHRSTLLKPLPWRDIADVSYVLTGRAPSLAITLRDGTIRRITGIDNSGSAAETFAAEARRLASQAS